MNLENILIILEKYKLTPTELFTVKLLLLAKEDGEYNYISRFYKLISLRDILKSLQNKGIILKSWKLPKEGEKLNIEDIPFNQNFQKQYYRASFKMGEELFNVYPQSCFVNGQLFNLKSVSHKFDSLEDAYFKYAKYISNSPEKHQEVIDLVKWGIDNNYNFTTLDRFIVDRAWLAIKNVKEGNAINVNSDAVKLI